MSINGHVGQLLLGLVLALAILACGDSSETLRISGSTTVNPIVVEAAEIHRSNGHSVLVDTQGGSSGGLSQLRQGQIDIAMSSKPLEDADVDSFVGVLVARDAVGVAVHPDVAESLSGLSRDQLRAIFEGFVTNWSEVGGPDIDVYVYDKEPGRGTREVFDAFLYQGETPPARAAHANYAIAGANEESRLKISTTEGAIGPLSVAFIDESLAALAIDGVEPSIEEINQDRYPIVRPLLLVTDGRPDRKSQDFINLVLSETGREIIASLGYLPT